MRVFNYAKSTMVRVFKAGERGMIEGVSKVVEMVISIVVGVVVLGAIIVALWGQFVGSGTGIAALTQTDVATTTLKAFWPIALIILSIVICVAVIYLGIKYLKEAF